MQWLKQWFEYAVFRAMMGILRLLPLDTATALAGALARRIGPLTSLHRRAQSNYQQAYPGDPPGKRDRVLSDMWANTGRTVAETFMIDRILDDPARITLVNPEPLKESLSRGGPRLAVTLHFGNWELSAWGWQQCGGKLAAVYRPQRNPLIDAYLRERRSLLVPDGFLQKGNLRKDPAEGRAIMEAIGFLRKGGHLGLVCDQVDDASPFVVPFFGRDATFTPGPAMLARRMGAEVWLARCERVDNQCRFEISTVRLDVPRTADADADIKAATAIMARQFEGWIAARPEQWMWWQRRGIGDLPTA